MTGLPPSIERRALPSEIRAAGRGLTGYIATFGTVAKIGRAEEVIRPGAFAASLRSGADILALVDHDPSRVLGRTKTGTLRLAEDATGLRFDLDLPDTTAASDVLALAARGDIGGASFGFRVPRGGDRWTGECRELLSVELMEVSIVNAHPAYAGTSITVRSRPGLSPADIRRELDWIL
jgi:HK97 family phage prohead protease